jgi:hypothetical protein
MMPIPPICALQSFCMPVNTNVYSSCFTTLAYSSLSNQGKVAEAATVAEDVADLLDRAFDWDCLIVAEARKEVSTSDCDCDCDCDCD